jgi:aminotransferase
MTKIFIKKEENKMIKDWRLSNRVLDIQKSAIHEMTRLSKNIDDVAFLSWAKPNYDTPEHVKQGAINAIKNGLVGGYSENAGLLELRREIVKKLKRDNNIKSDISQIIVTIGAVEGLSASIMALINPGDEVILPSPTYSTHIDQVNLALGKTMLVPTIEKEGFTLDIDAIRKAITPKTKAIIYCSPTNPAGAVFSEKSIRQLADIALENNLMVITDEAYEYFTYDGYKHFSIASIPEMKKNTVSCFTFTKTYAMTGWRIGYLHADEELIPQITKAHNSFAISAPVVSQYAALAALQGPQNCIADFRKHYLSARDLMCKRLDDLSSVFEYQKPRGAYLMFPKILFKGSKDSTSFCKKLLKDARVSTTPGVAFGSTGESHLRLSFCVTEEMIIKAFDRMDKYFNGY